MQTLELINERFARQMRHVLLNFMRRSADITVGSIKIQKYADFERNLPVPSNLNMIQMKPLRGTALFTYDPNLVFLVIDSLFGGDGRYHTRVEGRDFTTTEQRIIQRLLNLTLESYGKSWDPVYPIEFEYVRSEMHKFASITGSNEVVVVSSFHIEFGATGGDLNICLPYSMIEPVRDLLTRPLQETALEEVDQRWAQQLSRQVRSADIDVVAEFARIPSSIRELMRLKVGDVLPVDVPQTIIASVDGVPLMECGYGVFNGQYALRVHNMFTHDSDSNEAPTMTDKNEPGTGSSPADDWADALAEQSRANPPTPGRRPEAAGTAGRLGRRHGRTDRRGARRRCRPGAGASPAPSQPAPQPAAQSVFAAVRHHHGRGHRHRPDHGRARPAHRRTGTHPTDHQEPAAAGPGLGGGTRRLAGEPMDIFVNGYLIAQGEVVVVEDKYGIRLTDIITPSERINRLNNRR